MADKMILGGCIVAGGSLWAVGKCQRYAFNLNAECTRTFHPLILGSEDEIKNSGDLDARQAERKAAILNAAEDDRIREENALVPKWKHVVVRSVEAVSYAAFAVGIYYIIKGFNKE